MKKHEDRHDKYNKLYLVFNSNLKIIESNTNIYLFRLKIDIHMSYLYRKSKEK